MLFGAPTHNHFSPIESKILVVPPILKQENNILITDFTVKEVYEVLGNVLRKIKKKLAHKPTSLCEISFFSFILENNFNFIKT
jgi:hypothetical protein